MKVLELFSGTRSVGKICDELGWESISVDLELPAHHECDIMDFDYKQYPKDTFDVIWASPPCHTFSKIQDSWIGRKNGKGEVVSKETISQRIEKEGLPLLQKTQEIINYFSPQFYFIENPATSKMKDYLDLPNYVVDYCMYTDWGYRKSTRIWTNLQGFQGKRCDKNCGNMIGKLHRKNLANSGQNRKVLELSGEYCRISREDAYRIPPELIRDLFTTLIYSKI
jgi:hypothetical protein